MQGNSQGRTLPDQQYDQCTINTPNDEETTESGFMQGYTD